MKDLPEHVQYKLLRGNAERLYRFTPAEPPVLANGREAHEQAALDGKSAIVTGAGSGVGRVSALRFAQEGARVVVADINVDNAKETVRQIESAGGTAIAVGVDVSDEQQVQAMIAAAVDQYGRLDILFNNVGIPTPRLGTDLRGAHARGLQPPGRGQPRRGVPRLQARGAALQGAG